MEFMSRGRMPDTQNGVAAPAPRGRRKHIDWDAKVVRIEWFVFTTLLALVLLLVIGWSIYTGNTSYGEASQIEKTKYQAVFLNGGATSGSVAYTTYFGHITKLTDKYMILKNVYYLTTSQSSSSSQATPQLTKLGCQQLHSPYDEMVINRNQVAFWENLQDSGKVVQAIKQFVQQNPNGPDCSAASSNNSSSSSQNATTPSSSTSSTNANSTTH